MFRSALAIILMAAALLLITAGACAPAATAPSAPAPAAANPTITPADSDAPFPAQTYTNDEYKFSIKYPKDWTIRDNEWEYQIFTAKTAAVNLPGLTITVYPESGVDKQKEQIEAYYAKRHAKDLKWGTVEDYTLPDGTKGKLLGWTYIWPGGYELESYTLAVEHGGKWITFGITGVQGLMDYQACKDIFNTLKFK